MFSVGRVWVVVDFWERSLVIQIAIVEIKTMKITE
jgi:hypothetical protein